MTRHNEILEVFSYSEKEQAIFPLLKRYMNKISPYLDRVLSNPEMEERFMLAGLFLTYQAFNHLGVKMTTEIDNLDLEPPDIHRHRLLAFKKFTGKSIRDSHDYLKMIRFSIIKWFFLDQNDRLYHFVMKG